MAERRLLKKALAASNQLSEGYSPWAKYKIMMARRATEEEDEPNGEETVKPHYDSSNKKDRSRDSTFTAGTEAGRLWDKGRMVRQEAALENEKGREEEEEEDNEQLDVTIPLSDTLRLAIATTASARGPSLPPLAC